MSSSPIVFFDLGSKDNVPFSWRTWSIRLLLNYKRVRYHTTFAGFSALQQVLPAAGIPPTGTSDTGAPMYTVPALIDPSTGTKIAETREVAAYLEKTYPTPAIALPAADEQPVHDALTPFRKLVVPGIVNLLEGEDERFYIDSRRKLLGKELSEICPPGAARDDAIAGLRAALEQLASTFPGSPWFFGGSKPVFLDFQLIGWLLWLKLGALPGVWDALRMEELAGGEIHGAL
ncbi:hypothetical protein MKEN_00643500 [Mycena kentingensis (nom. inval.)]|nr:hypothetical protein MKEN_00643500 [Mycena kentingensis (nom. inval.)]